MTAYVLLNHALTPNQERELRERFGADAIECPPDAVCGRWCQLPPESELENGFLAPVIDWLSTIPPKSPVVVSGDFGATFAVVDWCLARNLLPLYAATRRVSTEVREGETVRKENVFEHVCFKQYARLPARDFVCLPACAPSGNQGASLDKDL